MNGFTGKAELWSLIRECEEKGEMEGYRTALPIYSAPYPEIEAFAREYGFHPSFVHLVLWLEFGDPGFWGKVVGGLPEGADTRVLVSRWIDWLWTDPAIGLRRRIADPELATCGDAIYALQRRAAGGEVIDRSEWRRVRSALSKTGVTDPVQVAAAGGPAAVAWDLDSVPAAAADLIHAWRAVLRAEIDRDLDWNDDKQASLEQRQEAMMAAAQARVDAEGGAEDEDDGDEEASALRAERQGDLFQQGMQDYLLANPSDLDRRSDMLNEANMEMHPSARAGFMRQVELLTL